MDPDLHKFSKHLKRLSISRQSISETTSLALGIPTAKFREGIKILLGRMKAADMEKRISFLYLVDSISQKCHKAEDRERINYLEEFLSHIFHLAAPMNESPPSANVKAIGKVVRIWNERGVFNRDAVQSILTRLKLLKPLQRMGYVKATAAAAQTREEENTSGGDAKRRKVEPSDRAHASISDVKESYNGGREEPPATVPSSRVVVVWDLESTLALFQSLLDESFANKHGLNPSEGAEIGEGIEACIYDLLDEKMFYETLEKHNVPHIGEALQHDDGADIHDRDFSVVSENPSKKEIAHRYRSIQAMYDGAKDRSPLSVEMQKRMDQLLAQLDVFSAGWISEAKRTLTHLEQISATSVVMSNVSLAPSLARLLAFGLNPFIPARRVFSYADVGVPTAADTVIEQLGPDKVFIFTGNFPGDFSPQKTSVVKQVPLHSKEKFSEVLKEAKELLGIREQPVAVPKKHVDEQQPRTEPSVGLSSSANPPLPSQAKPKKSRWGSPTLATSGVANPPSNLRAPLQGHGVEAPLGAAPFNSTSSISDPRSNAHHAWMNPPQPPGPFSNSGGPTSPGMYLPPRGPYPPRIHPQLPPRGFPQVHPPANYARPGAAPHPGAGRGRGSVLPAWMTDQQ